MKKVMAMLISIMLLLTMAVAMPVSADTLPSVVYLPIENADFEADEEGSTTITGWTTEYDPATLEGSSPWIVTGGKISISAPTGVNKISQEITIPESVRANMADYNWYWKSTCVYCTCLTLQLTDADGATSVETAINDFDKRSGATHTSNFSITSGMTTLANPVSVKVTVSPYNNNNGASHDNIAIYGVKKAEDNDLTSLISNSDFWKMSAGVIDNWTLGYTGTPVNEAGGSALYSHVEKSDGSGDYYVTVAPEKRDTDGLNSGASGAVGQQVSIADAAPYLLTIKYKAINATDAYVKICDVNDGWKAHVDNILPATSEASTLEEAEWGTYKKILYMSDIADNAQSKLDIALRAHPNGVLGAWYDSITLEPISGVSASNYIANGDFEMDAAGATEILGWTQLSTSAHLAVADTTASSGSKCVGAANNGGLQAYVPKLEGMNADGTTLTLSFNSQYGGGAAMPAVEVIANRSSDNGGNVSYTYTSFIVLSETETRGSDAQSYTDGLSWEYKEMNAWADEDYEIGLSNLIELAGGLDMITGFTINLKNSNTAGTWDNVKLYPKSNYVEDENAIVKNGSFETDDIGSTTIDGWEQIGYTSYAVSGLTGTYLIPVADGGTKVVYSATGVAALKQTVVLDQTKEYYTDQDNYKFVLSGVAYAPGTAFKSRVSITAYDAEENSKTYNFNLKYDASVAATWTTNPFEVDFSHVMDAVNGTVTKFDIILSTSAGGGESAWDGITVTPVYDPDRLRSYGIEIVNADFEADEAGTAGSAITGWTPVDEATSTWTVSDTVNAAIVPTSGKLLHGPKNGDAGTSNITQTVEIPVDADYFANMDKYNWHLSFSGYYITYVDITAYNSDRSMSATGSFSTYDRRADWAMNSMDFDITSTLMQVGKARYLDLTVKCHGANPAAIDAVMIWATEKSEVAEENLIVNPGFETKTDEGALADWEAAYPAEYGVYEHIYDARVSPSGFGTVKLTSAVIGEGDEAKTVGGYIRQKVTLTAGQYYVLEATYNAADNSPFVEVADPDDDSKLLSVPLSNSGGAWLATKTTFKAPETKEYEIRLRCYPGGQGVTYENIKLNPFAVDESALTTEGNKIVNGGFEQDYTDSVTPIGWDVVVNGDKPSKVLEDSRGSYGSKLLKQNVSVVSQTIAIPEYNVTESKNYGYKLGFAYGSWDGGLLSIKFDFTFADERENFSHTFTSVRVDANGLVNGEAPDLTTGFPYHVLQATPDDVEIDLSFLTEAVESPLTTVKVSLIGTATPAYLDNFTFVCTEENPEMRPAGEWTYTFYDDDGETVIKTVTGVYGTPVIAPENPVKEGTEEMIYVFTGWGEDYSDDLMLTNANYTFTASYQGYGKTEVSEDKTTFTVGKVVYGAPEGSTVILAIYRNGRMIDVQQQAYTGAAPVFTFTNTNYDEAKVMVWSKLGALKPIVAPEIVELPTATE